MREEGEIAGISDESLAVVIDDVCLVLIAIKIERAVRMPVSEDENLASLVYTKLFFIGGQDIFEAITHR